MIGLATQEPLGGVVDAAASQKTLGELIEACWTGEAADVAELRGAVCALSSLLVSDQKAMQVLAAAELACRAPMKANSAVYQNEAFANRLGEALTLAPMAAQGEHDELALPMARARRQVMTMLSFFFNRGVFQ